MPGIFGPDAPVVATHLLISFLPQWSAIPHSWRCLELMDVRTKWHLHASSPLLVHDRTSICCCRNIVSFVPSVRDVKTGKFILCSVAHKAADFYKMESLRKLGMVLEMHSWSIIIFLNSALFSGKINIFLKISHYKYHLALKNETGKE